MNVMCDVCVLSVMCEGCGVCVLGVVFFYVGVQYHDDIPLMVW